MWLECSLTITCTTHQHKKDACTYGGHYQLNWQLISVSTKKKITSIIFIDINFNIVLAWIIASYSPLQKYRFVYVLTSKFKQDAVIKLQTLHLSSFSTTCG